MNRLPHLPPHLPHLGAETVTASSAAAPPYRGAEVRCGEVRQGWVRITGAEMVEAV